MRWLAQICEAVAAAHQAGVVHGDLTPNNILLDHNGRIVITDFGFATYAQKPLEDDSAFESIASPGGTLGFAAPEQISPALGTIGFSTDIYAIGGLAYYLLTGQIPLDASSLFDTVADENLIVSTTRHAPDEFFAPGGFERLDHRGSPSTVREVDQLLDEVIVCSA